MFKKLLASIGVGGAKIDTRLDNPRLRPGEVLSGHVLVQGGNADQDIEKIELVLMTEAEQEAGDHEARGAIALGVIRVAERFTIRAGETRQLPFQLLLPAETPVNALPHYGRPLPVWIHTDLAIAAAVDANDRDLLEIHPTAQIGTLLAAFEQLGWPLYSTDVEVGTARVGNVMSTLGCYQEFELKPRGGNFRIQEIELTFIPYGHDTHVLVEVDSRFGGDGYLVLVMGADFASRDWAAELRQRLAL
ncbi:sporulation protein [Vogesella indigofera]|uniref:sporulation protein n=1 Tax=Vogesella indigofera TaxID=45465 RepID=UPI00234D7F89|nr:sporulation protein [Vogesella indigofera]MDC7702806.1 sporulation protein [Vogesella indigofera]